MPAQVPLRCGITAVCVCDEFARRYRRKTRTFARIVLSGDDVLIPDNLLRWIKRHLIKLLNLGDSPLMTRHLEECARRKRETWKTERERNWMNEPLVYSGTDCPCNTYPPLHSLDQTAVLKTMFGQIKIGSDVLRHTSHQSWQTPHSFMCFRSGALMLWPKLWLCSKQDAEAYIIPVFPYVISQSITAMLR